MIRRNTGRLVKSFLGPRKILGVLTGSRGFRRLEGVSRVVGVPPGVSGGPRGPRCPSGPRVPAAPGLDPTFPPCQKEN